VSPNQRKKELLFVPKKEVLDNSSFSKLGKGGSFGTERREAVRLRRGREVEPSPGKKGSSQEKKKKRRVVC